MGRKVVLTVGVAVILVAGLNASAGDRPTSLIAEPWSVTVAQDCLTASPVASCYSPSGFREAYDLPSLLEHSIDGQGRSVALLESPDVSTDYGVSDIYQDVSAYDRYFGLPSPHVHVVGRFAGTPTLSLASLEEVEDVEIVHAVAPGASVIVVLFGTTASAGVAGSARWLAAFKYATTRADVVSLSMSQGEHRFSRSEVTALGSALALATSRHVTVVASSGDLGAVANPCNGFLPFGSITHPVKELGLPASDPLVLSVGGTRLRVVPSTGAYLRETAWSEPAIPWKSAIEPSSLGEASGGGYSHLFARPSYQDGVAGIAAERGAPDVAADAAPETGLAVLSFPSYPVGADIQGAGGTSAGAPLWAAIMAIADQFVGRRLGWVNPAIYRIAQSPHYGAAFHDITEGNNTVSLPKTVISYKAGSGWDPVTGWGTPNVSALIPLLAHYDPS
jgi:subtilase family serine protease